MVFEVRFNESIWLFFFKTKEIDLYEVEANEFSFLYFLVSVFNP